MEKMEPPHLQASFLGQFQEFGLSIFGHRGTGDSRYKGYGYKG